MNGEWQAGTGSDLSELVGPGSDAAARELRRVVEMMLNRLAGRYQLVREYRVDLRRALDTLDQQCRRLLVLCDILEESRQEIAASLEISSNALGASSHPSYRRSRSSGEATLLGPINPWLAGVGRVTDGGWWTYRGRWGTADET